MSTNTSYSEKRLVYKILFNNKHKKEAFKVRFKIRFSKYINLFSRPIILINNTMYVVLKELTESTNISEKNFNNVLIGLYFKQI